MAISETDGSLRKNDDRRLKDSFIANPVNHHHSENDKLLHTPSSRKFDVAASKIQEWEQESQVDEIEKTKRNSECNLRQSFAWDSAFFTSAGVLDPEELSCIIEGVKKDEKRASWLSRNQEDVHKSCETISSLESDGLSLESLEADLFVDASQKSSSRVPNVASGKGSQTHGGCMGHSPKPLVKSTPTSTITSKRSSLGDLHDVKSEKDKSKRIIGGIGNSPKTLAKSSPSSTVSSNRASLGDLRVKSEKDKSKQIVRGICNLPKPLGKSSPSSIISSNRSSLGNLRDVKSDKDKSKRIIGGMGSSPNTIGKSSTSSSISSKRASLGDLHVKSEKDKLKRIIRGIGNSVTNISVIKGSPAIVPKPIISSKSPSDLSIATKAKSPYSTCSGSKLSSNNVVTAPSKTASRDKIGSSNSSLRNRSSKSSSTSTAKYRSNNGFSKKDLSNIDAQQGSKSQNLESDLEGRETQHTRVTNQCVKTAASGMVLPPAPKKPSSLQLPSPNIVFFEGVKSLVRTSFGGNQPHSNVPHCSGIVSSTCQKLFCDTHGSSKQNNLKAGVAVWVANLDVNNTVAEQYLISIHKSEYRFYTGKFFL
ncbi:hypothetical protein RJT34_24435 [Clitoria ternatea]|uniref:Uncharacterized protein n=1 Tax=Clitoria ternatea TaxID=43366 RepID=A0AAN9II07_CLITE